jgi:GNAT superfamily N-acetyltransferase
VGQEVTDSCHIRPAAPDDAPTILAYIRGLAAHTGLQDYVTLSEERLLETFFGPNPACQVILAEVDGRAVGFASYMFQFDSWRGGHYLYLDDLYVQAERRGEGIGRALLGHLASIALERNYSIHWKVTPNNERALAFYRTLNVEMYNKIICIWREPAMQTFLSEIIN